MQLSVGVNSNQVGFWQTLLYSNNPCSVTYDGQFQTPDRNATISFQQGVLGYPLPSRPADGIVGWRTFDDTQNAVAPGGFLRLIAVGGNFFNYYGGVDPGGDLYWQGGATGKWKYKHPVNGIWYVATNSLSQPSLAC
jgi:hypothetical protein